MAISRVPRIRWAWAASSAARAGSGCLRLTPRITFQPLLSASVAKRWRSVGVSVATAQDGRGSPFDVQKVMSTKLAPKRITPGPRVFMYWKRLPADGAVPARMLASKENPTKLVPSLAPEPDPTVTVAVAAGASSATGAIDLSGRIRRRGLMGVLGGGVARSCRWRSGLTSDV